MKVCFLAGTLGRGGAERQLLYMLRALKSAQIETRLLCLTSGESFEKEITDSGVQVEWVGASGNKFTRLRKIIENLRKQPPDIFQSAHFYTNLYAAAAGKILRLNNIGAIRGNLTNEIAANGIYGKWQLSLPQLLIANSISAKEKAIEKGVPVEAIEFVRNVVEGEVETEKNARPRKKLNVLFAGRLEKVKRPELFINLAARLRQDLPEPNLHFQLAGDGALRPELEKLACNLGLDAETCAFLGLQTEMSEIYRQADVLVLTSEHEGTPNVILEAMAYGVPVVAAKVGGVPEILSDECGVLVEPNDQNQLFEAAAGLILDESRRREMGRQGREYVEKNHSLDYLQNQLVGIYNKLLNR